MLVTEIDGLSAVERRQAEAGAAVTVLVVPTETPGSRLAEVGTEAQLIGLQRLPDGRTGALVKGTARLAIVASTSRCSRVTALVRPLREARVSRSARFEAALRALKRTAIRVAGQQGSAFDEARLVLAQTDDASLVCDLAQSLLSSSFADKLASLASEDLAARMALTQKALSRELGYLELAEDIRKKAAVELQEAQRQEYLREQVRVLQAELGEGEDPEDELDELELRLEELPLPPLVREAVDRELERMRLMAPGSSEYMVSHTYVTWLRDLPWDDKAVKPPLPLAEARRLLDRDHYGLEPVKERILEYLAVMRHRKAPRGEILLLAGPPGVGKTTLARSVATALNRPFVRVSLGGVKDEAEIRGHRRTYVGSLPGKIIQAIKQAGTTAPLILLDEIDKLGLDYGRGAMASALLEVLDEEQNKGFVDHYLAVPYDLSKVVFMATANNVGSIPRPLLDRMETIELQSYSEREKLAIATRHLLPELRRDLGLTRAQFNPSERVVLPLIREYSREAGVRQLKRDLATLGRKVVKSLVMGRPAAKLKLTPEALATLLGPPRYHAEPNDAALPPGVAIGLAYTAVGGDILYIESSKGHAPAAGKEGRLKLTGSLGKVMRESAEAAVSYLVGLAVTRPELLGVDAGDIVASNLHLHFPDGATPKDGPSAGVAIMAALASLMTGRSLPSQLAMTGEITLRGQVLPVGGIKEKLLAAHRYGKRRVIIPAANAHDLAQVPKEVLDELEIVPVRTMDEVLRQAGLAAAKATSVRLARRQGTRAAARPRLAAIAGASK
jgi:ATP-dependent Lon protease